MSEVIESVKGVAEVVKKIKENHEKIGKNIENALKKAGLELQRASQLLVPVNFGVLKASAYTRAKGEGFETDVTVGYTANYAIYVHEAVAMKLAGQPRPDNRGLYWDPQGQAQAKFLEQPARKMAKELGLMIKEAAKI